MRGFLVIALSVTMILGCDRKFSETTDRRQNDVVTISDLHEVRHADPPGSDASFIVSPMATAKVKKERDGYVLEMSWSFPGGYADPRWQIEAYVEGSREDNGLVALEERWFREKDPLEYKSFPMNAERVYQFLLVEFVSGIHVVVKKITVNLRGV